MSSSVGSQSHDFALLEAAYQIGKFIQSVAEDPNEGSGNPSASNPEFCDGPSPSYNQTQEGLILEEYFGIPLKMHTPYGQWTILKRAGGNWRKVMEAIKAPLGLEVFMGKSDYELGPYWAITKWQELKMHSPVYRDPFEYLSHTQVKAVWQAWVASKIEAKKRKMPLGAVKK